MGFLTKRGKISCFNQQHAIILLLLFKKFSFYECRSPRKVKETVDVWVLVSCYIIHLKLRVLIFNKYKTMKMISSIFKKENFLNLLDLAESTNNEIWSLKGLKTCSMYKARTFRKSLVITFTSHYDKLCRVTYLNQWLYELKQ